VDKRLQPSAGISGVSSKCSTNVEGQMTYELYKKYFEEIYEHYPRKEAKESAYLEYLTVINMGFILHDDLMDKVKRYAHKMKGKETYVITFYKWLNGKRWEDDLPELPTQGSNDAARAKTIIVKLGSGFASPDAVRWLKSYIAKHGTEGLSLNGRDKDLLKTI
jgi:hypothetical protein